MRTATWCWATRCSPRIPPRFWPLEGYEPGHSQPSFDKQFVRDWLKANPDSNYDLPQDVIDKTIAKYLEAYELLTGKKL